MRTTVARFATAGVVLLGLAGFAQPAAAAPAEPYRIADCRPFSAEFEYCYESKGVFQENLTRPDNPQEHVTEQTCYTVTNTSTGEVLYEGCFKDNFVFHQEDGRTGVYHANEKHEWTFTNPATGTTHECTSRVNATLANGEYKHSVLVLECNPPL